MRGVKFKSKKERLRWRGQKCWWSASFADKLKNENSFKEHQWIRPETNEKDTKAINYHEVKIKNNFLPLREKFFLMLPNRFWFSCFDNSFNNFSWFNRRIDTSLDSGKSSFFPHSSSVTMILSSESFFFFKYFFFVGSNSMGQDLSKLSMIASCLCVSMIRAYKAFLLCKFEEKFQ